MPATAFMERLNQIRAAVRVEGCPEELRTGLKSLMASLKERHSPDALKRAVSAGEDVPTDLEEAMTTLFMTFVQHRGSA